MSNDNPTLGLAEHAELKRIEDQQRRAENDAREQQLRNEPPCQISQESTCTPT